MIIITIILTVIASFYSEFKFYSLLLFFKKCLVITPNIGNIIISILQVKKLKCRDNM